MCCLKCYIPSSRYQVHFFVSDTELPTAHLVRRVSAVEQLQDYHANQEHGASNHPGSFRASPSSRPEDIDRRRRRGRWGRCQPDARRALQYDATAAVQQQSSILFEEPKQIHHHHHYYYHRAASINKDEGIPVPGVFLVGKPNLL